MEPTFPVGHPRRFRATVHGTVFADRARFVEHIRAGDSLTLVVDPALSAPRSRVPDSRSPESSRGGTSEVHVEGSPEENREPESPEVVWVHLPSGEPVGYLPREIGCWLAPWILRGGSARAYAIRVSGPDSPSWRRLLLLVSCG